MWESNPRLLITGQLLDLRATRAIVWNLSRRRAATAWGLLNGLPLRRKHPRHDSNVPPGSNLTLPKMPASKRQVVCDSRIGNVSCVTTFPMRKVRSPRAACARRRGGVR